MHCLHVNLHLTNKLTFFGSIFSLGWWIRIKRDQYFAFCNMHLLTKRDRTVSFIQIPCFQRQLFWLADFWADCLPFLNRLDLRGAENSMFRPTVFKDKLDARLLQIFFCFWGWNISVFSFLAWASSEINGIIFSMLDVSFFEPQRQEMHWTRWQSEEVVVAWGGGKSSQQGDLSCKLLKIRRWQQVEKLSTKILPQFDFKCEFWQRLRLWSNDGFFQARAECSANWLAIFYFINLIGVVGLEKLLSKFPAKLACYFLAIILLALLAWKQSESYLVLFPNI